MNLQPGLDFLLGGSGSRSVGTCQSPNPWPPESGQLVRPSPCIRARAVALSGIRMPSPFLPINWSRARRRLRRRRGGSSHRVPPRSGRWAGIDWITDRHRGPYTNRRAARAAGRSIPCHAHDHLFLFLFFWRFGARHRVARRPGGPSWRAGGR
jgi:hypothetical protein